MTNRKKYPAGNNVKPKPYKFKEWLTVPLDAASEKQGVTTTEILVRAACRYLKIKIPKEYKFRAKNKTK